MLCDLTINTDLVVTPGGMTSQLQVLEVVVNKSFKDHLKQIYSEWLLAGDHILTPTGKIKEAQCNTAVPVDQDIMARNDHNDSQRIKKSAAHTPVMQGM
jgi:hypothetical protein